MPNCPRRSYEQVLLHMSTRTTTHLDLALVERIFVNLLKERVEVSTLAGGMVLVSKVKDVGRAVEASEASAGLVDDDQTAFKGGRDPGLSAQGQQELMLFKSQTGNRGRELYTDAHEGVVDVGVLFILSPGKPALSTRRIHGSRARPSPPSRRRRPSIGKQRLDERRVSDRVRQCLPSIQQSGASQLLWTKALAPKEASLATSSSVCAPTCEVGFS